MEHFVFIPLAVVGVILQVMVIWAMSRGFVRRYFGVFFYLLVLFLTAVADFAAYLDPGQFGAWYQEVYYINNTVRQLSGFVAVLTLIFTATANHPQRVAVRVKILLGTAIVVVLSFSPPLAGGETPNLYITNASRNLSFSNALLNVILWFSLVKARASERRLFLVSGGLGLNMAGEAIAQSLVGMSTGASAWLWYLGNFIAVPSHLLCLLIWWTAFRRVTELSELPSEITSRERTH